MTTILDVAHRAGVSIKTVSRVINREPHVREETRAQVLAAMHDLGYVANVSARRLASGRADAIGFVFYNPSWQYLNTALQGVIEMGDREGYDTVIHPCNAEDPKGCAGILDLIARRSVDGLVFTPPCDVAGPVLSELQIVKVPFVRITPRDRTSPLPFVTADDRQGAYDMTCHLLSFGHRRIGFIVGSELQLASFERLEGYRAALAAHDVPFDPALVQQGDFSFESGLACGHTLLEGAPRPSAVFASNDDMAAGVLAAAHALGLAVPEQLSVAGFDNVPLAWQVWPALTTVEQPIYDIAVLATRLLIRMLRGEDIGIQHLTLPTRLVARNSTGAASAG